MDPMKESEKDHTQAQHIRASADDLERLVKGIQRALIVDLVKRTKHLQRRVFRGYRPDHLPWDRVAAELARDAHDSPEKLGCLLDMWVECNADLCSRVREDISLGAIEEGVAQLLASLGPEDSDRVLWALLLDEREEVQQALDAGLRDALTTTSSSLFVRAEEIRLRAALRTAQEEAASLRGQVDGLEELNRLLRRKGERLSELEEQLRLAQASAEQVRLERQEAMSERDGAFQRCREVEGSLAREGARTLELERSLSDLKASFDALVGSQRHSASEVKQQLAHTVEGLEGERKENAKLRLTIRRLEQDLESAYGKRDQERERAGELEEQIGRLQHDKEVLIAEKRELDRQLTELQDRHRKEQLPRGEETEGSSAGWPSSADAVWSAAVEDLLRHLKSPLPEPGSPAPALSRHDRWADWNTWLRLEAEMVRPVLRAGEEPGGHALANAERAQKLLVLRWYLLEWLRRHEFATGNGAPGLAQQGSREGNG